jgi:RNA-directed DNA polymerase
VNTDAPAPTLEEARVWVLRMQTKLHQWATDARERRFDDLYNLVYHPCTLEVAWERVRANRGARSAGVDGVRPRAIGAEASRWLAELRVDLKAQQFRPDPVRERLIPKPGTSKVRRLGIPTARDRVVQAALKLVLEPIFEADFVDSSYGFRPGRSAHDALTEIRRQLQAGRREVYDADLQGYFDTIPHDQLLKCLRMRVVDRSVLALIQAWLQAPVVETDDAGRPKATRPKQGTPQGGVISPLLANIYLHWFEKAFYHPQGPATWAKAAMIRYADDFVILAHRIDPRLVEWVESQLEGRFRLTINRSKTRTVDLKQPSASVDFLGYTFRFDRDLFGRGGRYLNVLPSKRSLARFRDRVRELTASCRDLVPVDDLVRDVTRYLAGWGRYFAQGYPRRIFNRADRFVLERLVRHLQRRSQRPFRPPDGKSFLAHLQSLGLQLLEPSLGHRRPHPSTGTVS